jgi:hypothetical protein
MVLVCEGLTRKCRETSCSFLHALLIVKLQSSRLSWLELGAANVFESCVERANLVSALKLILFRVLRASLWST